MANYQVRLNPDPATWDQFVDSSGGHFLQLAGWGNLKSAFGWQADRVLLERQGQPALGAQILYRRLAFGPLAYIPRGPVGPDRGAWPELVEAIRDAAARRGASFIKLESTDDWTETARAHGFRPSALNIQPRTTMLLDLTLDLQQLTALQNENTRRNIRSAARKGVTIRTGDASDLDEFYRLSEETSERDGFGIHSRDYYEHAYRDLGDRARLFVAEANGVAVGAIFVVACGGEATYLYGASSSTNRQVNPNQALQWHAMQWAREQGCTRYDFWGIPEALADDPEAEGEGGLWGVYRFKRGFGGAIVAYPKALDLPLSAPRYALWRLAFGVASRLRPRGAGGV